MIAAGHALCPAISLHGGELKRSQIPQGDKTLHFDTIWIGKAWLLKWIFYNVAVRVGLVCV